MSNNLPEIFNSKGAMRDLTQIEADNLAPDDLQRFELLRNVYVENLAAEQHAAEIAKEITLVAAQVKQERLEAARRKPVSEISAARAWIATQAAVARGEL
jgi:hypothetical protein